MGSTSRRLLRATRRSTAAAAATTVVAALLVPAAASAATTPGAGSTAAGYTGAAARVHRSAPGTTAPDTAGAGAAAKRPSVTGQTKASGPVSAVLELDGPTSAQAFRQAGGGARGAAASRDAASAAQRSQAALNAAFARPATRAQRVFAVHNVYDGVLVHTDASRLQALAALPGVKAVHVVTPKTRSNARVVPLTGAPTAWAGGSGAGGYTGKGIRIGIIDTGIDYMHANFGGPGTAAGYAGNDTKDATDEPQYFGPNAPKVKGGYDFAGDAYNADPSSDTYNPTPAPDPDPEDCASALGGGHGSHVAGSAAGFGVETKDGTGTAEAPKTYSGPYTSTTDFSRFTGLGTNGQPGIGPGVAPEADLYALRVFGCNGSTDLVLQALDYAADPNGDGDFSDRLDVVNMSLGSDGSPEDEPDAVATDALSALGTTVVVAAGNAGDNYYEVGSPGSAESAVTVAATDDDTAVVDAVKYAVNGGTPVSANAENSIALDYAAAYKTKGADFTGTLVYPWSSTDPTTAATTNNDGCDPFSDAAKAAVAGKWVLLEWNDTTRRCGSVGRSGNAKAAGALGAVFLSDSKSFSAGITGDKDIPVALVSKPDADLLRTAVRTPGNTVTGEIGYALRNAGKIVDDQVDTPAGFTSRGGAYGSTVKPDLAAPGVSIFSTASGTGTDGQNDSGTSMATPHTAGAAALVRQAHPFFTPAQVKADLMNTAGVDVTTQPQHAGAALDAARVGAGRIQVNRAVANGVLAYDSAQPTGVSASFGNVAVTEPTQVLTRTVTLANTTGTAQKYDVGLLAQSTVPGAAYSVSPSTVSVAPAGTATVTVTLTLTRAQLEHTHAPSVADTQTTALGDLPRVSLAEATSLLTFKQAGVEKLRLPVYAAPRAASTTKAAGPLQLKADGTTAGIALTGSGFSNAPGTATESTSLVSGYELAATSGRLPACSGSVTTACLHAPSEAADDLKAVGVSSTYVPGDSTTTPVTPSDRLISFAFSTYAPVKNPGTFAAYEVDIDTTGDQKPDVALFNARLKAGNDDTDVLVAEAVNYTTGKLLDVEFLNGVPGAADSDLLNTDTVVLPVLASLIGLTGDGSFTYVATTYSPTDGSLLDTTDRLSFRGLKPGLSVEDKDGTRLFPDAGGATLPVSYDPAGYAADGAQGVLLVHHHGLDGQRAEVVALAKAAQTITAPAIGSTKVGTTFAYAPTSSSGLPVTVTSTTPTTCLVGSGKVTASSAGTCTLQLTQAGNGVFAPAAPVAVSFQVVGVPGVTLTVTPGTQKAGKPFAVNVAVQGKNGPTPTGAVTLLDGGKALGSLPLVNGVASTQLKGLSVGRHVLTATYGGDAVTPAGTSSPVTVTVVAGRSALALSGATAPRTRVKVPYTATLRSDGPSVSGRTVAFYVNGKKVTTGKTNAKGQARAVLIFSRPGTVKVSAAFLGAPDLGRSGSGTLTVRARR